MRNDFFGTVNEGSGTENRGLGIVNHKRDIKNCLIGMENKE